MGTHGTHNIPGQTNKQMWDAQDAQPFQTNKQTIGGDAWDAQSGQTNEEKGFRKLPSIIYR